MATVSSSFLYWTLSGFLLLTALSGLFLWKGRGWIARLLHARRPSWQHSCLDVLERLGLEGKTFRDDKGYAYAIEFNYRQVCFILELEKEREGDMTTLIVPNLHQGYLKDMDRIMFCLNRFNCHPRLLGRAIVALVRDEDAKDEPDVRPELDVRILDPLDLKGHTRKDAKYLRERLEDLMTSVLWLLSLLNKTLSVQGGVESAVDDAQEYERQRLQEVLDFLNPTHLPS